MQSLNNSNLLTHIKEYFEWIGVNKGEVQSLFNEEQFDRALVLNLPVVSVVNENKPNTTYSKQTHIHVTGEARFFFYSREEIENAKGSSDDKKVELDVSQANLKHLGQLESNTEIDSTSLISSYTLTKIALRANNDVQVQISKIRQDEMGFIKLRKGLYTADLLIFLGYKSSTRLLAVGIPASYYCSIFTATNEVFWQLKGSVSTVKTEEVLERIKMSLDTEVPASDADLIEDIIYQRTVQATEASETDYSPQPKPGKTSSTSEQSRRNPQRGKEAIKDNAYKCGLDKEHITFMSRNGTPYVEAHHFIPMSKQDDFENSLDVKSNIIPLCSLCHDKIHYGTREEVSEMLEKLYESKKELLKRSGIHISLAILKAYYEV